MKNLSSSKEFFKKTAASLEALKRKSDLTPNEWMNVVYETWAICANHDTHSLYGGTISSNNLRVSSEHLSLLNSGINQPVEFNNERPLLEDLIKITQTTVEAAKAGVARHNRQKSKFVEYHPETGEPIERNSTTTPPSEVKQGGGK